MWTARFAVGFALVSILACAGDWRSVVPTYGGYEEQLKALVGHSINDAVMTMGPPTRTVELAQGQRLYVWEQMSDAHTAVEGTKRWNPQTQQEEIVLSGGERVPFDCTTQLEADAAGNVTRYQFSGIACLGQTPLTTAPTTAPSTAPVAPPAVTTAPPPAPTAPPPATAAPAPTATVEAQVAPADRRALRREVRAQRREGSAH